ncbi:hypothetical protein BZL29_7578 [Mycobacterium kansasii]|uniref:Uncharacterized protein n=1 Tax=Mycobacterium kansasii TaxID=1768 RepID=A0A1V3WI80_MYCKA|nr:hypothetical protein BZL29_7578 [Mycobacterium kansasii]
MTVKSPPNVNVPDAAAKAFEVCVVTIPTVRRQPGCAIRRGKLGVWTWMRSPTFS